MFMHWEPISGSLWDQFVLLMVVLPTTWVCGPYVATSSKSFDMSLLGGTLPPAKFPGGATEKMQMFSSAGHGGAMPLIPALKRQKLANFTLEQFQASQGCIVRPCLKETGKEKKNKEQMVSFQTKFPLAQDFHSSARGSEVISRGVDKSPSCHPGEEVHL